MKESFSIIQSVPLDWETSAKPSPSAESTGSHESSPTSVEQFPLAPDDDSTPQISDHHRGSVSTYFSPNVAILPFPCGMDDTEATSRS
jgi:hypothetical protein